MVRLQWVLVVSLFVVTACGDDVAPLDAGAADATSDGIAIDAFAADVGLDAPLADGSNDAPTMDVPVGSDAGDARSAIGNSTLLGKHMMGYQGWFGAAGDGSPLDRWRHWSPDVTPTADTITFDAWPDLREWSESDLYDTGLSYSDGSNAQLFSSYDARTVDRHFRWMREYDIDGVFLQQFVSELRPGSRIREMRDAIGANVYASAQTHGRVFAVMYDLSGANEASAIDDLVGHYRALVESGVTASERYLHHDGLPVVAIWGLGFNDRIGSPAFANDLLDAFEAGALEATVLGGVPSRWRTLESDSKTDPAWAAVYRRFDILSPWSVGRYANDADIENFARNVVVPDIAECAAQGIVYLPVVWPGFSWTNLRDGASPLNQIPRLGGRFYWRQVNTWVGAGATQLYGAMFDEVDEATAMFKIAETAADAPGAGRFLTLDADGESIPSDFYLRLATEAGRLLRGERAPIDARPIDP